MSANDYDATMAERYGWINRAFPVAGVGDLVASLAHRIEKFPASGRTIAKERMNAIALPRVEELRDDSTFFLQGVGRPEYQNLMQAAMRRGFQSRDGELNLGEMKESLQ